MSSLLDDVRNKIKNDMTVTEAYDYIRTAEDDDDDEEDAVATEAAMAGDMSLFEGTSDDGDETIDPEDEDVLKDVGESGDPATTLGDEDLGEDNDDTDFTFEETLGSVIESMLGEDPEDEGTDLFDAADESTDALCDRLIASVSEDDEDGE